MSDQITDEHQQAHAGRIRKLFLNHDFGCLWAGQSVSLVGSSISFIGLPLVAVLILHVSPFQLGLISAAERLPPVLFGPFAGPVADRYSRYRIILIADIGRAVLLATVPVAVLSGDLGYWQLVLVAFGTGTLTLFFNVAFQAYLPSLVPSAQVAVANARLGASQSAAEVSGPGLAAGLIALGGAAVAVAADAASYVFSAISLGLIRRHDTRPAQASVPAGETTPLARFLADVKVGFRLLRQDDILRIVTRSNAILTFFAQMQAAVYFLFLTRALHFTAGMISIVFTAAGVLGLFSAVWCNRVAARVKLGHLIVYGQLILALGGVLLATATGPVLVSSVFITAGEACFGIGFMIFSIGYQSLFQLRTADEVRGRVIGAARFITSAPVPLAALFSGVVGDIIGVRATLIAGAAGMTAGLAAVLGPRVWNVGRTPLPWRAARRLVLGAVRTCQHLGQDAGQLVRLEPARAAAFDRA